MIRFFAGHPTAANLLMFGIIVGGVLSLGGLRRETFPDFAPREVEVRVAYPGATAEDVEEAICRRIEDAIDGVRFVEEVRSEARRSLGTVTVEMVEGGDYGAFKDEIDTAVAAIDDFPDRAEEPVVAELNTIDPVLTILVSGEMSRADLKLYAEDFKDRLQARPGVSFVEVDGFSDHQLRVEMAAGALVRFGLSPADVADAVRRQSVDLPGGTIETRGEDVLVRFAEERTTAGGLADLVILGGESGAEVRVRDIGTVVDDFQIDEEKVTLNGRPAALVRVQKVKTEDAIEVAAAAQAFLEDERVRRPAVDLVVTENVSELVQSRLGMLVTNCWQGMVAGVRRALAVFQHQAVLLGGRQPAGVVPGGVRPDSAPGCDDQHALDGRPVARGRHPDGRRNRDRRERGRPPGPREVVVPGGRRRGGRGRPRRVRVVPDDRVRARPAGLFVRQHRPGTRRRPGHPDHRADGQSDRGVLHPAGPPESLPAAGRRASRPASAGASTLASTTPETACSVRWSTDSSAGDTRGSGSWRACSCSPWPCRPGACSNSSRCPRSTGTRPSLGC